MNTARLIALSLLALACAAQAQVTFYGFNPAPPVPQDPLTTNLVAYWKLDEEGGTRADSSGNGYDLSVSNAVTYQLGKLGNAAEFNIHTDQRTNSLYIADNAALSLTNTSWTISFWTFPYTNPNAKINFLGKSSGTDTPAQNEYAIWNDNSWRFRLSDGTANVLATRVGEDVTESTWYHVLAWFDLSKVGTPSNMFMRVNLGDAATNYIAGVQDGANPFFIGWGLPGGAPSISMFGLIDEVGIWNRVLTMQEMTNLYNGGSATNFFP